MKKIAYILLSLALAMSFLNVEAFAKGKTAINTAYHLYVSAGADASAADGSKEKPFATIDAAKEYVKTLDKTKGDIIVEIADGEYFPEETLVFDESDSGFENCTVRYIAAEGANPVISGGRMTDGKWKSEGNGIFSTEYNRNKKLRSLYVNGRRCFMTSNVAAAKGGTKQITINEGQADWAWTTGDVFSAVKFSAGKLPSGTRNQDDIELMTQTRWNTTIVCVDSLEKNGLSTIANLQMPYAAFAQQLGWGNEYQFRKNNMIFNVFEWLDEPGEFYFDKSENKLYYYAREDEDMNNAQVIVPELDTIVKVEGTNKSSRVHNISFEGLTFAYSDWNLCESDGSFGRATNQGAMTLKAFAEEDWHGNIYREYDVNPAAVYISSASDIELINNTIAHTGNDGLSLVNDVRDMQIDGNIIYDTAGTAMLIGHIQHMYISDKDSDFGRHSEKEKYDTQTEALCGNISITNNLFKNTSRLFWGNPGVIIHAVENMLFKNNQLENTPYSGLSLGWGWWNFNGSQNAVIPGKASIVCRNNKIVNNSFYNCITTLGDGGAIYTLSEMPDTVISKNYIKSIGTEGVEAAYHIRGIHIDEGTKYVYGEKNVIDINPEFACIDCGDWGYKGENVWKSNFSTSDLYTTTETFEPGTKIINPVTLSDVTESKEAKSVIENAGIKEEYRQRINQTAIPDAENIASIPNSKAKTAIIIAAITGTAVVMLTALALTVILLKKRSNKKTTCQA